jgi:hypothetical protein
MAKKETNTKLEITICDLKSNNGINIESLIRVIRGQQVMLDSDLAMLYGVETRTINQAVKRNNKRFPEDFMFQLTQEEASHSRSQFVSLNEEESFLRSQIATSNKKDNPLRSQFVTSNGRGGTRYLPYAFTRNGIAMLSSVLRSDTAVEVNIRIMRAFTMIPQLVNHNAQIIERIFNIEQHQQETDKTIKVILDRIEDVSPKLLPEQVFPTGCIWDAWTYISDLIRSARKKIVLIDNYVDDRVLSMFTKRAEGVSATIFTRHNEQFLTDLKKHNAQYPEIKFIQLPHRNHDRFLIIDDKVYLLGASLKDMGAGLCAVTEMSIAPEIILELLK